MSVEPLRERLEHYACADGDGYTGPDGCFYEDVTGLVQCGILDSCMCGRPEQNIQYVLGGFELIAEKRPNGGREDWDAWYQDYVKRCVAHFGNDAAEYFFWYWTDSAGYTEHGGSVPGWLTGEGEKLIGLLREWKSMPTEGEEK